ncbi:MAG: hypothetical protein GY924_06800 [Planctomycetaceae bacterium]|nr:hypothetical protein [Planctomycetaceae bacterium]
MSSCDHLLLRLLAIFILLQTSEVGAQTPALAASENAGAMVAVSSEPSSATATAGFTNDSQLESLQAESMKAFGLVNHVAPCDGCDAKPSCDGCGGCCHSCQCPLPEAPCVDCPRITTLNPNYNISIFGALTLDMLYNSARPVSPGTPFFLASGSVAGLDEQNFDTHARQSTLAAALSGPQFSGFQSGGLVMAAFYNDAIIVDQYGFLPLQAYGELTSSNTRFAAGLQFDVFSPGAPTVLPFSVLNASGNSGNAFRGQLRLERFIRPTSDRQITLQFALSEPVATTIDPLFRLSEDNGWPNIEGRMALGCGVLPQGSLEARRDFEIGVSGVIGQLRTTLIANSQTVADVWGLGVDFYCRLTDCIGFTGEWFTGQGLGTYNAGVLQGINLDTGRAIEASGGWLEVFVYWTPCVHAHFGYGVDDPNDSQVTPPDDPVEPGVIPLGRTKNQTYFANMIWDVNSTFRIGAELAYRDTDYLALPDNNGLGFQTQFRWSF